MCIIAAMWAVLVLLTDTNANAVGEQRACVWDGLSFFLSRDLVGTSSIYLGATSDEFCS